MGSNAADNLRQEAMTSLLRNPRFVRASLVLFGILAMLQMASPQAKPDSPAKERIPTLSTDEVLTLMKESLGRGTESLAKYGALLPADNVKRTDVDSSQFKDVTSFGWDSGETKAQTSNAVVDGKILERTLEKRLLYVRGPMVSVTQSILYGDAFQHRITFSEDKAHKPVLAILTIQTIDKAIVTLELRLTPYTTVPPFPSWAFGYQARSLGRQIGSVAFISPLTVAKVSERLGGEMSPILVELGDYGIVDMDRPVKVFGTLPSRNATASAKTIGQVLIEMPYLVPKNLDVAQNKVLLSNGFSEEELGKSLPVVVVKIGSMRDHPFTYQRKGRRHEVTWVAGTGPYLRKYEEAAERK